MKDIRLVEILKTFDDEEIKSFGKFLLSPFIKSRRNIGTLLSYISNYHPEYPSPDLSKEVIFKALYPGENYNDKKMVNLIYDLTKAAESYLIHSTIENDEIESQMILCRGYFNKKLINQSVRIIKNIENILKPGFSSERDFFIRTYKLESIKSINHLHNDDFEKFVKSIFKQYESSAVNFLIDFAWMMSFIKMNSTSFFNTGKTNILDSISGSFDFNNFLKFTKEYKSEYRTLIDIHYYIIKTVSETDNSEYYYLLKKLIFNNIKIFDREEKFFLLKHLCNCAVEKYNNGLFDFGKEVYLIWKKMLEHNAYSSSESENMQLNIYRNILNKAIDEKEKIVFIENFIENYIDKLNPEEKEGVKEYSYAYFYFYKKEFDKALEIISKISHINTALKMDYRILILKIHYELNNFEQAFSLVDSFRHFFKNDKEITELHKEETWKFLRFYLRLLKLKPEIETDNFSILKKEFEKSRIVVGRKWIEEKINEKMKSTKFKKHKAF